MNKKLHISLTAVTAIALLLAICLSGAPARADQAMVDNVISKLGKESGAVEVPLERWKMTAVKDESCLDPNFVPGKGWKTVTTGSIFAMNENGYWFWTKYKVPETLNGLPTKGSKIFLSAGVERSGEIYINGQWKHAFTHSNGEAVLTINAIPGEEYSIVIRAANTTSSVVFTKVTLRFSAFEAVQQEVNHYINDIMLVRQLMDFSPDKEKWNAMLDRSASLVDLSARDSGDGKFVESLRAAKKELEPVKELAKQFGIYLIGYSHIDLAWLWDKQEGEDVWRNTTKTILTLFEDYPEWIYCAGQAAGYYWMEKDYPKLFEKIKQRVAEGRWEIVGGTWAEFDSNLPGGESYIRQLVYGKRYFREKFNKEVVVGWTPDSFGYNWNLAQIYKKAGMIGFLTQKINWNDTTRFPHHIFWWEGPDGSRLMTYFPVGGYGDSMDTNEVLGQLKTMKQTTGVPEVFAIFGVGDHGGGVTRTQLNRAFAFKENPLFPPTKFVSSEEYFKHLLDLSKTNKFPVYKDELYLEYHRGTYTSQANTKLSNRRGETAIMNAETFNTIAARLGHAYPQQDIRKAWDHLMFNQFHDILPGSSINKVYRDNKKDYAQMFDAANGAANGALKAIAAKADTKGKGQPLVLFNSLSWKRDDVVEAAVAGAANSSVLDAAGKPVPSQVVKAADGSDKLLFVARGTPAMGYATYRIVPGAAKDMKSTLKASGTTLENEFFKVTVDPKTGNISSLIDKRYKREYFGPNHPGNELQCYHDKHPEYDAWNIRLHERLDVALASAPEIVENGPVRATLRWTKTIGKSTFVHNLSLVAGVPQVFGRLDVDWHESHVMAKLAFDLNLKSDNAWYEIPYAAISRAAYWKNDFDRAKWEVSAQKWADYPDGAGKAGFSIINNSKYGYDTKDNVMRLSLLRSPKEPDPEADMGKHTIEYALYPHAGDWRKAQTPRRGWEFNTPLVTLLTDSHAGSLPAAESFFSVEPNNVIMPVVKKAEDSEAQILRLYEAAGKDSNAKITLPAKPKSVQIVNLMEEQPKNLKVTGREITVPIGHYEILTLKIAY